MHVYTDDKQIIDIGAFEIECVYDSEGNLIATELVEKQTENE